MGAAFSQNLRRVDFQDFFSLLQLGRLQLTVVCCNRRVVWTPHFIRRIFSYNYTPMRGSSCVFVVRTSCVIVMCLFWLFDYSTFFSSLPIFSLFVLSSPLPINFHLPRCGGQIPCALSLMRTLAPLPSPSPTQVMSPTTTTSRRLRNHTSRNPPARKSPWTRMTLSTMTTPSAWRSLHHCSPRSEKMMRAEDEPITLKEKACRPVCRRQWVMIERGNPLIAVT